MGEFSKFISEKRRSLSTPADLIKDGKSLFGTFDKEFETMDFVSLKNPTDAPDFLNAIRLTLWEATEVHLEQGYLLTAVCNMGIIGVVVTLFYDQRTRQLYQWTKRVLPQKAIVAPNLMNGSVTECHSKRFSIRYVNNFQEGRCDLNGFFEGDDGTINYNFKLSRLSKPSVVSIPFEDPDQRHRPLYSQKDFFKAEGFLTLNGHCYKATEWSTAIIDDHRGYYPHHLHYDWNTFLGRYTENGKSQFLAYNLTENQSINPKDYNENLIWFEGDTSLLPPVTFKKDKPTIDFDGHAHWEIRDEHDMVHIDFEIYQVFSMITHAKPAVNIEYFIVFGEINGYLRDEDGKKYVFDHVPAMGEDKDVLL